MNRVILLIAVIDCAASRWFAAVRERRGYGAVLALLAAALAPLTPARADNFVDAHYDADTDELVVSLVYRGSNPDHAFSLQWGACQTLHPGDVPEVVAVVIDDQWKDDAVQEFKKTVRFPLEALHCARPIDVTLRTPPRFYLTLRVPAANPRNPAAASP
jgi:hypothetical protein